MPSGRALLKRMNTSGVPGSAVASVRQRCDLAGHHAGVLRNDLAKGIALDGDLLTGVDLVVQPDQELDEPALGRQDGVRALPTKSPVSFPVRPIGPAMTP